MDDVEKELVETRVADLLLQITRHDKLKRDSECDWTIKLDNVLMNIMVGDDDYSEPIVRLQAIAAFQVASSPDLFELLNELNSSLDFSHAYWTNRTVFIEAELYGARLDIWQLGRTMERVTSDAISVGQKLIEKCAAEIPKLDDKFGFVEITLFGNTEGPTIGSTKGGDI